MVVSIHDRHPVGTRIRITTREFGTEGQEYMITKYEARLSGVRHRVDRGPVSYYYPTEFEVMDGPW